MNVFLLVAAVLFFVTAINVTVLPNEGWWGFFFLALGLLTNEVRLPFPKRP